MGTLGTCPGPRFFLFEGPTTGCGEIIFLTNYLTFAKINTHTHTRLTAVFRDYPGEPVPER